MSTALLRFRRLLRWKVGLLIDKGSAILYTTIYELIIMGSFMCIFLQKIKCNALILWYFFTSINTIFLQKTFKFVLAINLFTNLLSKNLYP
jgi:hypothetical protein